MANEEPKPWVKKHLDERGVDWGKLKPKTQRALNAFSEPEITKLNDLGKALKDDDVATNVRVSAVH